MVDLFQRYFKQSRVILFLKFREFCPFYVHIYIFRVISSKEIFFFFLCFCICSYRIGIFLNRSTGAIDGTLTGTTTPGQSGPGINGNE